MKTFVTVLLTGALTAALAFSAPAAPQTPAANPPKTAAKEPKKTPTAAPTAAEIADAKSKGMVWVNLNTKVYHKDGEFYGNTKRGKFMPEADATKGGYRAATEPKKKVKSEPKTK